eukprot:7221233-Pyramimonas_sp.AAC.1
MALPGTNIEPSVGACRPSNCLARMAAPPEAPPSGARTHANHPARPIWELLRWIRHPVAYVLVRGPHATQ